MWNLPFGIPLKCKRKHTQMIQFHIFMIVHDCLADKPPTPKGHIFKFWKWPQWTKFTFVNIFARLKYSKRNICICFILLVKSFILSLTWSIFRSEKHWILIRTTFDPSFANLGTLWTAGFVFFTPTGVFQVSLEDKGHRVPYSFLVTVLHNVILVLTAR